MVDFCLVSLLMNYFASILISHLSYPMLANKYPCAWKTQIIADIDRFCFLFSRFLFKFDVPLFFADINEMISYQGDRNYILMTYAFEYLF